jgi:predicted transcriptional regulator
MKQFLVELDARCARDLERVAPAKDRKRSEFVRLAIRRAIDLALDVETAEAYAAAPLGGATAADLAGWDPDNALAMPAKARARKARGKRAA